MNVIYRIPAYTLLIATIGKTIAADEKYRTLVLSPRHLSLVIGKCQIAKFPF